MRLVVIGFALSFGLVACRRAPTSLADAAARGTKAEVEAQLSRDPASLEKVDAAGETPLHTAARTGNTEAIEVLLAHGALVDAADPHGDTPLHLAAAAGQARAVELLLDAGASFTLENGDGRTPLLAAVASRHGETAALLRDIAGADPRARRARHAIDRGPSVNVPLARMQFRPDHGAELWEVWGDRGSEEHEAVRRARNGWSVVPHSHGSDLREIVLVGTLVETLASGEERRLPPGSALMLPHGEPHAMRCEGAKTCVWIEHMLGPADEIDARIPVEGPVAAKVITGPALPIAQPSSRISSSAAWQDPVTGESGSFMYFASGMVERPHHHMSGYDLYMIDGVGMWTVGSNPEAELIAGGYQRVPAGAIHSARCISERPCFGYAAFYGPMNNVYDPEQK